mgnify:CR=1 FL=1
MKFKKKFILLDNKKYNVVEHVIYNDKVYVYLVNSNDEFDSMFREFIEHGGKIELKEIEATFFSGKLSSLFREKILNS